MISSMARACGEFGGAPPIITIVRATNPRTEASFSRT